MSISKRQTDAACWAHGQAGTTKFRVLAGIPVFSVRDHMAFTLQAAVPAPSGLRPRHLHFRHAVFPVLQQFVHKVRRSILPGDDRDRLARPGERHIEHAALFGMLVWLRLGKHKVKQGIVDNFRRQPEAPAVGAEYDHMVRLESF